MLPIYRIRDGRQHLSKNRDIFDSCSTLLAKSEQILVFPEANHCMERRVRPLSKGFARILFKAFEEHRSLEVLMVAVGVNYSNAASFPDSAAFYFGTAQATRKYHSPGNEHIAAMELREQVSGNLRKLTTHIPSYMDYSEGEGLLDSARADYLDPSKTNSILAAGRLSGPYPETRARSLNLAKHIGNAAFILLNLPVILLWRGIIKPCIKEVEFITTYSFLFGLFLYPLAYIMCFFLLYDSAGGLSTALLLSGHILMNRCYIKYG
jgi:hypothetical protein